MTIDKFNMDQAVDHLIILKKKFKQLTWGGASPQSLEKLLAFVDKNLEDALPSSYVDLLAKHDGLTFNGFDIYGVEVRDYPFVDGFIEANRSTSDGDRDFVLFGESPMDIFGQNVANKSWSALDRSSLTAYRTFSSFEAMVVYILDLAIGTLKQI